MCSVRLRPVLLADGLHLPMLPVMGERRVAVCGGFESEPFQSA